MRGILHERNPDGTEKMYSHKHAKILYQIKTPTYKKFGKYRTKFAIFFKVKTWQKKHFWQSDSIKVCANLENR